jgi:predicted nucleic acid-binding protein
MPAAEFLFDSNVLIYALLDDSGERAKRERAKELIATSDFGISYQVLMEVWVVATRKLVHGVAPERIAAFFEGLLEFPCVPGTEGLYRQAVQLVSRFQIHPYDAAIIAAAQELGAGTVYSEDLSHGQDYDGVKVVNPFRLQRA